MASYTQASGRDVALQLVQAAHPRLGVPTAVGLAAAAYLAHHPTRQVVLILVTALIGQAVLGWHNDLVDEPEDRRHQRDDKPLIGGGLGQRAVWIALTAGGLALIPLATAVGVKAGLFYVGSLLVAMTGNVVLRTGALSFVTWAVSYALLAPYVSFAAGGPHASGRAPEPAMVACFALVGIGVHVAVGLWGLVADDADGWTSVPLVLGRKYGATQTMAMVIFYLAGVAVAVTYVAHTRGFSR